MTGLFTGLSRLWSETDEEAMLRVKAHNDDQAFDRLVRRWERPIWRLCARMTGDIHRAEDLKQETFVRLFEKRSAYQNAGRFSTYLWRIALNLCYDELRRRERRRKFIRDNSQDLGVGCETAQAPDESPTPDTQVAQSEEGELVRRALMELPDMYRSVLVLRHYEGLKLAQIGEVLQIPEGTVNSRMAEALTRLSRILEPKLTENPTRFPHPHPFIQERTML